MKKELFDALVTGILALVFILVALELKLSPGINWFTLALLGVGQILGLYSKVASKIFNINFKE